MGEKGFYSNLMTGTSFQLEKPLESCEYINTNISVKKKSGQLTNAPSEAPKVVDE